MLARSDEFAETPLSHRAKYRICTANHQRARCKEELKSLRVVPERFHKRSEHYELV